MLSHNIMPDPFLKIKRPQTVPVRVRPSAPLILKDFRYNRKSFICLVYVNTPRLTFDTNLIKIPGVAAPGEYQKGFPNPCVDLLSN